MWCNYNTVNFLRKYSRETPHSSPVRSKYGVFFYGFSFWLIFCPNSCNNVCNTMLYKHVLDRVIAALDCNFLQSAGSIGFTTHRHRTVKTCIRDWNIQEWNQVSLSRWLFNDIPGDCVNVLHRMKLNYGISAKLETLRNNLKSHRLFFNDVIKLMKYNEKSWSPMKLDRKYD